MMYMITVHWKGKLFLTSTLMGFLKAEAQGAKLELLFPRSENYEVVINAIPPGHALH